MCRFTSVSYVAGFLVVLIREASPRGLTPRRRLDAPIVRATGSVGILIDHPNSRCTSFNLAGMSISWEQVGRQSPQPTQAVPFRVREAYSFRARSTS